MALIITVTAVGRSGGGALLDERFQRREAGDNGNLDACGQVWKALEGEVGSICGHRQGGVLRASSQAVLSPHRHHIEKTQETTVESHLVANERKAPGVLAAFICWQKLAG